MHLGGEDKKKKLLHLASLHQNVLFFFVLMSEEKMLPVILWRIFSRYTSDCLTTGLCHSGPLLQRGVMPCAELSTMSPMHLESHFTESFAGQIHVGAPVYSF